jgi:MFS family permease
MTGATPKPPQGLSAEPPPAVAGASPWLAAVAIVPILATVYQTLVLTDVTNDVIRKGITAEHYSMIWTNVCWGVTIIYGLFAGIWAMARFGARDTLLVGLVWFALGNLLCGAATDVPTLAAAKLVEGIGKGMVIVICRSLLYRQFDRMVIVAIGFYGVIAYATRPTTPLLTALVNDALSWRWIFWLNVPFALLALPLVHRFIKPDRPPRPLPLRIDWVSVTLFATWIVCLVFVFGWYRKWGGWSSNAFTATVLLALVLPVALVAWVGSGLTTASEHLRRMLQYAYARPPREQLPLRSAQNGQRAAEPGKKKDSLVSPATVNKQLRHFRAVLGVAKDWGYLKERPRFRVVKEPKKLITFVNGEHFAAIFAPCDQARKHAGLTNVTAPVGGRNDHLGPREVEGRRGQGRQLGGTQAAPGRQEIEHVAARSGQRAEGRRGPGRFQQGGEFGRRQRPPATPWAHPGVLLRHFGQGVEGKASVPHKPMCEVHDGRKVMVRRCYPGAAAVAAHRQDGRDRVASGLAVALPLPCPASPRRRSIRATECGCRPVKATTSASLKDSTPLGSSGRAASSARRPARNSSTADGCRSSNGSASMPSRTARQRATVFFTWSAVSPLVAWTRPKSSRCASKGCSRCAAKPSRIPAQASCASPAIFCSIRRERSLLRSSLT